MVSFLSVELYPLDDDIYNKIESLLDTGSYEKSVYRAVYRSPWETEVTVSKKFRLFKLQGDIATFKTDEIFDLVYFDAFAPDVQPELWTSSIFRKISSMMAPEALLATYSSKGAVLRNMKEAGLRTQKIPGPPRKREITVATKTVTCTGKSEFSL